MAFLRQLTVNFFANYIKYLSFVKDTCVVGKQITISGPKMTIYHSQILENTLQECSTLERIWTHCVHDAWSAYCLLIDGTRICLTPNTPLIQTSFTYRKLNMDEICGLKFYLSCVHTSQNFLLKSLHAQRRSFLVLNLYF